MLITNNPRFLDYKEDFHGMEIRYEDVEPIEILRIARSYVHDGYQILNHPLYGNFRAQEIFFRTIIVAPSEQMDLLSLELIENSINKIENILQKQNKRHATDKMIDDYSYIDFQIIKENVEGGMLHV